MKDKSRYFTTGEFAALCNVRKQTLFYYDEIGLFSPDIVGENGYRYYSYPQIEVFTAISMLKDLGMPLKDIQEYVNHRTPERLMEVFARQKEILAARIERLRFLESYLDSRLELTRIGIEETPEVVFYEDLPETLFIVSDYQGGADDRDIAASIKRHLSFCANAEVKTTHPIGGMLELAHMPKASIYAYDYLYNQLDVSGPAAEIADKFGISSDLLHVRPAGRYAAIYHHGGFDKAQDSYARLLAEIGTAGLKPTGFFYEDTILDDLTVFGYDNYAIKILIKVE